MRIPLVSEMLAPVAALLIAVAAAVAQAPILLLALPLLWFAPAGARQWLGRPLDEREAWALQRAEAVSLRLLLVAAAAVPALVAAGGAPALQGESADMGFVLLAVFVARAMVLAETTLPRAAAAQTGGAFAVLVAATMILGRSWPMPVLMWIAIVLVALPHAVVLRWPGLAALLWGGVAVVTSAHAVAGGFAPIESLLIVALLAAPWGAASLWALRSGHGRLDDEAAGGRLR